MKIRGSRLHARGTIADNRQIRPILN